MPPSSSILKFNTDVVWNDQFFSATIAIVVQNDNGVLLDGVAKQVRYYSPLAAKARACLRLLDWL